jgi:xylan 1,4-beta-xylosidase
MSRKSTLQTLLLATGLLLGATAIQAQEHLTLDASAPAHPLPHFWERMFGSGRAVLSLRDSYRQDLRSVKSVTSFSYVRFHGILMDENGVYDEDLSGQPVYNFSYVDQIYDGLLANGVRPFVELSFMPKKLAAQQLLHAFWYKQNISPPKDYARWDALISALATHLIERYGIAEVSQWYFEVWNEPNLDFWGGTPRQSTYWELYDHTAKALKAVDSHLRVGGPATAQAAWVPEFIQHGTDSGVPIDFVSTHVYGDDTAKDVFGTDEHITREHMVCRAVKKVHDQIKASSQPSLPLIWSEFNASFANKPFVTDSVFMGPWLADTIRQCDGLVDDMSYWTFSDVFEEQGVIKTPFYGGFGLLAEGGIPKPSYNAFALLHQLGDSRLQLDVEGTLLTRRDDGALILALWNYAPAGEVVPPRRIALDLKAFAKRKVTVARLDGTHGDVHPAYESMGAPRYPTMEQFQALKAAATLPAPQEEHIVGGELDLVIPSDGLVLVTLR